MPAKRPAPKIPEWMSCIADDSLLMTKDIAVIFGITQNYVCKFLVNKYKLEPFCIVKNDDDKKRTPDRWGKKAPFNKFVARKTANREFPKCRYKNMWRMGDIRKLVEQINAQEV